jgi:indolepyruvate ferredoxin oxidoreductase
MGMKEKLELGSWSRPAFRLLRSMRRIRGTAIDVFGWAHVRTVEREMIPEYVEAIDAVLAHLRDDNVSEAVAIAQLPDRVRGYEDLKLERAEAYRDELAARVKAFID